MFKVEVTGTTVTYLRNDAVFYTSATAATFPLHVDTSMDNVNAEFTDVTVCFEAKPMPTPAPACTETPPSAAAVGSSLRMAATAELAVSVDLLEDGMCCEVLPRLVCAILLLLRAFVRSASLVQRVSISSLASESVARFCLAHGSVSRFCVV